MEDDKIVCAIGTHAGKMQKINVITSEVDNIQ